jgi:hypothetical protein
MKKKPCCSIIVREFARLDGYYWEITVPAELHPESRIKEFVLDDSGLGWQVKLRPVGSINPVLYKFGENVYRGVIEDKHLADVINSCLIIDSDKSAMELLWH